MVNYIVVESTSSLNPLKILSRHKTLSLAKKGFNKAATNPKLKGLDIYKSLSK